MRSRSRLLLAFATAAAAPPILLAAIIPAVGEPTGASTRSDPYGAAGYGFYAPVSGTKVNRLGYWDQGEDGLAVNHDVMIVRFNGSSYDQAARVTVPAGTAARLENGYRWVNIPDLVLPNIGQNGDYYGIVASHGTDPWSNGSGNGVPMTPIFGTKQSAGLVNGSGPMVAGNVTFLQGNPGWGGANFGYEPPLEPRPAEVPPIKIMPMGDSITAGFTDNPNWNEPFEFGYRGPLAKLLLKAGYPFRFVGLSPEPFSNNSGDPTHGGTVYPLNELRDSGIAQGAHRGYSGISIPTLNSNAAAWIAIDDPDVILLHIGTNGIGPDSPSQLNTLVSTIFSAKPSVKLVVAQIIPSISYNQAVITYNHSIRTTLVPSFLAAGRNISTVDQYPNFLTNPSNNSSIDAAKFSNAINHPTNVAYQLMASTWLPAITSIVLDTNRIPAITVPGAQIAIINRPGASAGEAIAYDLAPGTGDTDNAKFSIAGGILQAGSHSFEADPAGSVYSIRIRATGASSGTTSESLRLIRSPGDRNPHPVSIATAYAPREEAYSADVSNNDLLQNRAGRHLNYQTLAGAPGPQLNDGVHGGAGSNAAVAWASDGNISSSTYEMGAGNGAGYDISRVTSIAAWSDGGYMNQKYTISVRYRGAAEFTPAPECSVNFQPVGDTGGGATKVIISRPGDMLFQRIDAIRFTMLDTVSNNARGVALREIDVEGLASALTPYESYMEANFPAITGSSAYPAADPDADDLSNLLEYAFGTNPGVPSPSPLSHENGAVSSRGLPMIEHADQQSPLALFGRRKDHLSARLEYKAQFSADLEHWTDSSDIPVVMAEDSTIEVVSVPFPPFVASGTAMKKPRFFRIAVTGN